MCGQSSPCAARGLFNYFLICWSHPGFCLLSATSLLSCSQCGCHGVTITPCPLHFNYHSQSDLCCGHYRPAPISFFLFYFFSLILRAQTPPLKVISIIISLLYFISFDDMKNGMGMENCTYFFFTWSHFHAYKCVMLHRPNHDTDHCSILKSVRGFLCAVIKQMSVF